MINRKDVIRVRMPFPDISSDLATTSHMYICRQVEEDTYRFLKCQTLKPKMLGSDIMQHYWDEQPDITRNPFCHATRIDCDKEFVTTGVQYDDALKTVSRPDVSDDVINEAERELFCDGYTSHNIDESNLLRLNPLVSAVHHA